MKIIKRTSRFRKDFKRYLNRPDKIEKLLNVVRLLEKEQPIPATMRPHKLTGNYKDCLECHIEGDLLLIWLDENSDTIFLLRFGTHSEVF